MLPQPSAHWVAQQEFGQTAHRLLWILLGLQASEDWVRLTQAEAAEKLNVDTSTANRAFRELEAAGVVHRGPRVTGSFTWRVNPDLWTGPPREAAPVTDLEAHRAARQREAVDGRPS
jgi:hypothetical protein